MKYADLGAFVMPDRFQILFKKRGTVEMKNNLNKPKMNTYQLAKMGMMVAVACILGLVRFPLIPAVSFLTYDLADIPILITAFAYGPVAGVLVTAVVSFIQAFLLGGDGIYGFIMHVIASGLFVVIAASFYKKHKTKKVAIIGLVVATLAMVVIMGVANYFITPYYYGGQAMREMVVSLMPFILLFNLIKGALNSGITMVVYKKISGFLHREGFSKGRK